MAALIFGISSGKAITISEFVLSSVMILNPAICVCPTVGVRPALLLALLLSVLSPSVLCVVDIGDTLAPPNISVSIAAISEASELYILTNIISFSLSMLFNIVINLSKLDLVSTIISVFRGV